MDPLIFRGRTWRISFLPFSVRKRSAAWVLSSFHNVRHRLILSQNPRNVNLIFVSFFFSFPGNFKIEPTIFLHLFQNRDSLSETFSFSGCFRSDVFSSVSFASDSAVFNFSGFVCFSVDFCSFVAVRVFSSICNSFFCPFFFASVLFSGSFFCCTAFFLRSFCSCTFFFLLFFFHSLTAAPAFFSGTPKR